MRLPINTSIVVLDVSNISTFSINSVGIMEAKELYSGLLITHPMYL